MKTILLLLVMSLGLWSQTRLAQDQYATNSCGRALLVSEDRLNLTVGSAWSVSKPCYVHFNLIPPTKVDPINVTTFVEPLSISIKSTFSGDDEVYVWATAPTFGTPPGPSKVAISTRNLGAVSCNCPISQDTRVPRIYPANSVPIGFALIRGGKFAPVADDILGKQQVFIGPGAEMALRIDQGGYWFEIAPASQAAAVQRAAAQALQLEGAKTQAMMTMLADIKPSDQEIAETKRVAQEALSAAQNALYGREQQSMQLEQIANASLMRMEEVHHSLDAVASQKMQEIQSVQAEGGFGLPENKVAPPTKPGMCDPNTWARDSKYVYKCVYVDGLVYNWVRFQYSQKW